MKSAFYTYLLVFGVFILGKSQILAQGTPSPAVYKKYATDSFIVQASRAISQDSMAGELYYERAELFLEKQDWRPAIDDYKSSIKHGFVASVMYSHLGFALSRVHAEDTAIVYLTKALELNPRNSQAYAHRGFAFMILNKSEAAESDYKTFLQFKSEDYLGWYNLGKCQENQKKYKEALNSFEKAQILKPSYADIPNRMALCYGRLGEMEKSVTFFSKAINLNPNESEYYYNRAIAKGNLKQPFCDDFQKAAQLGYKQAKGMYERYCGK